MRTKELILNYLKDHGLDPSDEAYGIDFTYRTLAFSVLTDDEDQQFLRIAMPCIFTATDENRTEVLEAVNRVNMDVKVSKTGIWGDDAVSIFVEMLLDEDPVLDDIFPRSLEIMLHTRSAFYKALKG